MASEASATSKRYLYIDSGDFSTSHTDGSSNLSDTGAVYEVQLTDPIHHVHSVSLLSLTLPYELYNVDNFNNTVTMALWASAASTNGTVYTVDLTIPRGMYTLDNLITALNDAIVEGMEWFATHLAEPAGGNYTRATFQTSASVTMTDTNVTEMTVTQVAGGLLAVTVGATSYSVDRVAFVTSGYTDRHSFKNSIWHRLGFVEHQIPHIPPNVTVLTMNTLYVGTHINPLLMESLASPSQTPPRAVHLGTESFDNLFVSCDLVSGQTYRTLHNTNSNFGGNMVAQTTRTDIIGIIPVSAALGGLLTWTRPTDNYMRIGISGRKPVDSLRISLTTDRGTPFSRAEFPGFSAVLEFTVIEHVDKINAQVHQANQRASFLSRHMPMQMD